MGLETSIRDVSVCVFGVPTRGEVWLRSLAWSCQEGWHANAGAGWHNSRGGSAIFQNKTGVFMFVLCNPTPESQNSPFPVSKQLWWRTASEKPIMLKCQSSQGHCNPWFQALSPSNHPVARDLTWIARIRHRGYWLLS